MCDDGDADIEPSLGKAPEFDKMPKFDMGLEPKSGLELELDLGVGLIEGGLTVLDRSLEGQDGSLEDECEMGMALDFAE